MRFLMRRLGLGPLGEFLFLKCNLICTPELKDPTADSSLRIIQGSMRRLNSGLLWAMLE